jgi:type IX secretion system PorP/SprF family membrane protein
MKQLLIIGFLFLSVSVKGQQDPLYNMYFFNQQMINPAYSGAHGIMSLSANFRQQWAGIPGAPNTNTLSFNTSFKSNQFGAGFNFINDRLGVNSNNEVQFSFAYKVQMNRGRKLSMGVQGGFIDYRYNYSDLNLEFTDDEDLDLNRENLTEPNFGLGFLYFAEDYYLSFSIPRLLDIEVNDGIISSTRYMRHFYLGGGYVFRPDFVAMFKPSFLLKYVDGQPLSVDLNAQVLLGDIVWAGITIRNFNTVGINSQIQITDSFRFGYAFEIPTNSLVGSNYGTHEIMVNIDLAPFEHQTLAERYF